MRKKYDKAFKSKVAIEALRGENTLQELSVTYQVHQHMIAQWKKELVDNAETIFEKKGKEQAKEEALEVKVDSLYKQIGLLQVEKEFLKKEVLSSFAARKYTAASRTYRSGKSGTLNSSAM